MPKISERPTETSPISTDLLVAVDDPSGTPVTKKVTIANYRQQVLLYDVTLTGSGTFTASSLSQNYDDLLIIGKLRGTTATTAQNMRLFFNGDTTEANYHYQLHWAANGVHSNSEGAFAFPGNTTGANSPTSSFSYITMDFPGYAETGTSKIVKSSGYDYRFTTDVANYMTNFNWDAGLGSAVTGLSLVTSTGSFAPDSWLKIYGIKYGA